MRRPVIAAIAVVALAAAALLAERGVTISDTMIEGVKGFAVTYGKEPQLEAAVKGITPDSPAPIVEPKAAAPAAQPVAATGAAPVA